MRRKTGKEKRNSEKMSIVVLSFDHAVKTIIECATDSIYTESHVTKNSDTMQANLQWCKDKLTYNVGDNKCIKR